MSCNEIASIIPNKTANLYGCHILYTRANKYWENFLQLVTPLGAQTTHLPLIETRTLSLSEKDKDFCQNADILFFTSAQAVMHFPSTQIKKQHTIVTIGKQTALAFKEKTQRTANIIAPAPYTSEALLNIWRPKMQKIAIIAAPEGRNLIQTQLSLNNHVSTIFAYKRFCPTRHWSFDHNTEFHVIIVTSETILRSLIQITVQDKLKLLKYQSCIATFSQRIATTAKALSFHHTIVASAASEVELITKLCTWWSLKKE